MAEYSEQLGKDMEGVSLRQTRSTENKKERSEHL